MSIFDQALHIPAEQPFFAPARGHHERVLLPLCARPAPRFYGAVVLSGFAALSCLVFGVAVLASGGGLGGAAFAAAFLAAAAVPAAIAVVGIRDLSCPAPILVVDAQGVRDRRLDAAIIPWTAIVAADIVAASTSGIQAVRLTLRADAAPRFNPFRFGGLSVDWSRRRRTRIVALMLLDVRAHVLAHAIMALAARHGAAQTTAVAR